MGSACCKASVVSVEARTRITEIAVDMQAWDEIVKELPSLDNKGEHTPNEEESAIWNRRQANASTRNSSLSRLSVP